MLRPQTPQPQTPRPHERGAVYVEFLLVFPPLLLFFLVILQTAILRTTHLGVQHAASAAVRSAVVVLPDDPVAYDGQPVNLLIESDDCSQGFVGKFQALVTSLGIDSPALPDDGHCLGGERMDAIRFAAIMRMLPFSPNPSSILPDGLGDFADSLGRAGWLAGAALYSYGATSVSFPLVKGGTELNSFLGGKAFAPGKPVTVRVSYLAHCGIPVARFLMCDSSHSLATGIDLDMLRRNPLAIGAAQKSVEAAHARVKAMAKGSGSPALLTGLLLSGQRFRVLQADASLPLNSAPYDYKEK